MMKIPTIFAPALKLEMLSHTHTHTHTHTYTHIPLSTHTLFQTVFEILESLNPHLSLSFGLPLSLNSQPADLQVLFGTPWDPEGRGHLRDLQGRVLPRALASCSGQAP